MIETYNHKTRDAYWQERWKSEHLYEATSKAKKKYYALVEFPYPSGDGLHVGHVRPYIGLDIIARKRRMEGFTVLYPMGWDAFGLPTENYAIKTGMHPRVVTEKNIATFKKQIQSLGASFDWSREINTTDPSYYTWTQWIFLQLFKKGLAYKATIPINWCLSCKIVLANEEVVNGRCERCGGETEKRKKEQWLLAITKYAERLLKGLDAVDYLEKIKIQQKNWIGKSEGAQIIFKLRNIKNQDNDKHSATVFTTRPDTIFGATFLAVSPELAKTWLSIGWHAGESVERYIRDALKERTILQRGEVAEKTGVRTDIVAVNPVNNKEIPVWIVNYVLGDVGTGAIMGVPAHDERDFEFAGKFGLPIVPVVVPEDVALKKEVEEGKACHEGEGTLINSGKFNGFASKTAKKKITKFVKGKPAVTYKLRDWIFSRQRYWGEPIPIVYCARCGTVPLPEEDLPLTLPNIENYKPTDTGESPLAAIADWVNTACPACGGTARRETDVMPNWAGSSWYYLAYIMREHPEFDLRNSKKLFERWMPVDWYNGGMEHTTLHLLYSRFWNQFLFDIGVVPVEEPYAKRTAHGLILAEDGTKMSKSKGNVINPDAIIRQFGADTLRVYEMFMGPFAEEIAWGSDDIIGAKRFLDKLYSFIIKLQNEKLFKKITNPSLKKLLEKTIAGVSLDIEKMSFNTAVAKCMIFLNEAKKKEGGGAFISRDDAKRYLTLVSPFAPHITEELWALLGEKRSIHREPWPTAEEKFLFDDEVTIVLEVNGKVRASLSVPRNSSKDDVAKRALNEAAVARALSGKTIVKTIFVENKLLNIVVS
jgi:leucyl-tRNA synthetase